MFYFRSDSGDPQRYRAVVQDAAGPPDPKQLIGGAFSDAAATYDQVVDFFGPFGRALVAGAAPVGGDRVLDLACGRGASLLPALEAVGPSGSVVGIDLAPAMVERLGADLAAAGVANAEVRVGDAEALDLPDASFDVALAGFVIFFAPDPPQVLRELHRVVRPGGRVALTIFDGWAGFPFVRELVTELVGPPQHRPSDEFNEAKVLVPALEAVGFAAPTVTEVVGRIRFADAAEVEAWMWSHAGRLLLGSLDEAQLARFRSGLDEGLEDHRVEDGHELVQSAKVVVATRP